MWKRRDGRQNGEIGAGRGLARRLMAQIPLALIVAIAGPAGRMRAALPSATIPSRRNFEMSPVNRAAAAALAPTDPVGGLAHEFAFSDADFRSLAQLAYEHAGISLADSKRNLVYSRVSRRLRALD